jgi:hypothetical protein
MSEREKEKEKDRKIAKERAARIGNVSQFFLFAFPCMVDARTRRGNQ